MSKFVVISYGSVYVVEAEDFEDVLTQFGRDPQNLQSITRLPDEGSET